MPQLLVFRGDFPRAKAGQMWVSRPQSEASKPLTDAAERALLLLEGYEVTQPPRDLVKEIFTKEAALTLEEDKARRLQVALQLVESFLQVERAWARHGEGDLAVSAVLSEASATWQLKTLRAHARLR